MASQQQERRPPARPPPPQSGRGESGHPPSASAPPPPVSAYGLLQEPTVAVNIETFRDLQKMHDKIYKFVNTGLEADEKGESVKAADNYFQGLGLMDDALRVNCEELQSCSPEQVDEAKIMLQKMTKTKQQITFRLQSIQREQGTRTENQSPTEPASLPSYEEAVSEQSPSAPPSYLEDEMNSLAESFAENEGDGELANATPVFSIAEGVQIFYITPEGFVSAPSYPSSLHIVKFDESAQGAQATNAQMPPAFLHVGNWMYPLVPGSSPALHTNYGAYIFPDLLAQVPGAAVGLMLPEGLPQESRNQFEDVIRSLTVYQEQTSVVTPTEEVVQPPVEEKPAEVVRKEEEREKDMSTKIASGILVAADWITWGVSKGAEKAGQLIKAGSEKLRERTQPEVQPRKVDPRIEKGVIYARQATHVTVKVTGFIVNKLGEATMALAREIAPRIRKEGEKYIPKSVTKTDDQGKSKLDGVIEVAASGLKGFGTVYMSLEAAAKSLGKSLTSETVTLVQHKYGAQAGNVTENTMYAVGNVALTAYNANHIGVKAVAKRTAKDTGKAVLEDFDKNRQGKCSIDSAGGDKTHQNKSEKEQ